MEKLKFGLNVKRKNIFKESAEGPPPTAHSLGQKKYKTQNPKISRKELEIVKHALEQDSDIFDYDKNYSKFTVKKKSQDRESKYIKNLLKVSEKRKMELEIAKEKKIQKDLELEQEFPKEKFVTQGYLDKLKELQDKELELREENPEKNLETFYRNLISMSAEARNGNTEENVQDDGEITPVENEEIMTGDNVIRNDSEEIIDKRLYLKGGLNLTKKITQKSLENFQTERYKKVNLENSKYSKKAHSIRSRETDFNRQKEQIDRKKSLEIQEFKEKLEKEQESKISDKEILSAKQRYLQRKNAQNS